MQRNRGEKNRMGETRDIFKKIRHNQGIFHAKRGTIEDRNSTDLTEAEILRRGGSNTQKNYRKKSLMTQIDNHDGVITHPEPDIYSAKSSGP